MAEQRDRGVNRGGVVEEEVGVNDQVVEPAAVGPQRCLIVGALVQVIPRDGVELFLSRVGKVEDVHLFEQFGEFAVFLVGAQQRRRGQKLRKPEQGSASVHAQSNYHNGASGSMRDQ